MVILKFFFFFVGIIRGLIIGYNHPKSDLRIISFLNEPTFGHKITCLDYLARLFPKEKIKLYVLVNSSINKYLFDLYREYIETRFIYTYSQRIRGFRKCFAAEALGLKKGIQIIFVLRSIEFFIPHPVTLYRAMNTDYEKMEVFRFSDYKIKLTFETFYSHDFLIQNNKLDKFGLQPDDIKEVYDAIHNFNSDATGKIVSIILRNDASGHTSFHDQIRDAGPVENYFNAAKQLSNAGYSVLLFGNLDLSIFKGLKNVIDAKELACNQDMLNIFSLTMSTFIIMQHSGPVHLANIASVPIVIADFLPLWQGSCGSKDLFVPKNFYTKSTGQKIPLKKILTDYQDIFFGGYKSFPDVIIGPSNAEDITAAVTEMVEQLQDGSNYTVEQTLLKNYMSCIPSKSIHAYRKNRISNQLLKKEFT
jgi:putative glycosyltransferase (TIGR04372 family)